MVVAVVVVIAKFAYLQTGFATRHVTVALTTYVVATILGFWFADKLIDTLWSGQPGQEFAFEFSEQLLSFFILVSLLIVNVESEDYRLQLRELLQLEQNLNFAKESGVEALKFERESLVRKTTENLNLALGQLSTSSAEVASQKLSEASESVIRPVSHYLMQDRTAAKITNTDELPKISWNDIFARLTVNPLSQPLAVAVISTFYVSRLTFNGSHAWSLVALYLLATFADFYLVSWLMQQIVRRPLAHAKAPGVRWLIQAISFVSIALIGHQILDVVQDTMGISSGEHDFFSDGFNFLIPLAMAIFPYILFQASYLRSAAVLDELEKRRNQLKRTVSRINEKLWLQRRQLAKLMHGPLQSALVAGAIQIHNAADEPAKLNKVIEETRTTIAKVLESLEFGNRKPLDLDAELAQMRAMWGDVCQLNLTCVDELWKRVLEDTACQQALLDIIGEATSNAVIHGKADQVDVRLTASSGQLLTVEVIDNGTPEAQNSTPGLGQQLFDHLCVTWSRQLSDSGATFSCTLPLTDA